MDDITDAVYMYVKRAGKDFEIKALGEYRDLYLCILLYLYLDSLLLTNVLGTLENVLRILLIRSCKISFSSRISSVSSFKKDSSKIRITN